MAQFDSNCPDPGDHAYEEVRGPLTDEFTLTFDTLTPQNRKKVLANARINKKSKKLGSPFRQFTALAKDLVDWLGSAPIKGSAVRNDTIQEMEVLIKTLEELLVELRAAD
jgi:hypothetical protein